MIDGDLTSDLKGRVDVQVKNNQFCYIIMSNLSFRISFQLLLCRVAALKVSPYIDIMLFLHFMVLWVCKAQHLFGNGVALNPGLGGVRDVASANTSHE